jgi:nitronate monooxygenase
MREMRDFEDLAPEYPYMNALTGRIRKAAADAGLPEFMSMWAGQGASESRFVDAGTLMTLVKSELAEALPALASRCFDCAKQSARHA